MDALRQRAASVGGSPGLEIRSVERANWAAGESVSVQACCMFWLRRDVQSEMQERMKWVVQADSAPESVGPSRVMSSIGWWAGKESVQGVRERIAPEEWSYMDIVASAYSPIVACVAEQEEVRKCMELLKKSFSIGQQRGCANANAKRKASVNRGGQRRRGNASSGARSEERGAGGMEGRQEVGRRGMSNYCASYYEVDWLLTLYNEGQCSGGALFGCKMRPSGI
ncbi:uncharacterized protein FOMMEDRAFT_163299 [Fomitiporia mediterranea MF3/22]|uniref:Uncharacterized protein n=1 Tax=Fomitiporia mediterranea (strain MF3/22) TaxID=694068 RepID=R7SGL6_FOMME|nr:uncharacterized protein FOMMEDRAFT_163299 [Fomitiporia mediterranea MF3/22]EJC97447.1 hypothetical protein FOMMEDRAFT_163299 [Fomitiporia mediterranea MF3/22]